MVVRVDGRDGTFRDEQGREVIFRGLNTGGRSKWSPFLPFDLREDAPLSEVRAQADAFFAPMQRWGLNLARMPLSWEAMEPTRGVWDERYLARYEALLDAAWANGQHVVLDFHQDLFAGALGGDGFPRWALPERLRGLPARHDNRLWFLGYMLDPDVQEAFDRLWANEDGLLDALCAMWAELARRFKDHPAVIGAEPLNEPGPGSMVSLSRFKREVLKPMFERVGRAIQAEAPRWVLFYGAPGVEAVGWTSREDARPRGEQVAHAPHLYDPATLGLPRAPMAHPPEPELGAFARFRDESGTPILLGEFGITHGAVDGARWLGRVLDVLDRARMSATLWEYSLSDARWNHEDLCVVDSRGRPRDVLHTYVRPWWRVVCGTAPTVRWDAELGRGEASLVARAGESVLSVAPWLCPRGIVIERISVNASARWDARTGALTITTPRDGEVSLAWSAVA